MNERRHGDAWIDRSEAASSVVADAMWMYDPPPLSTSAVRVAGDVEFRPQVRPCLGW